MALTPGQERCVKTLDRPLVVAAGAGSGKTFTLTKRIVGALQDGFVTDIDEVCAITFTTKAAAELKSRIKAELRACGLIDQALRVDEAWVSTIHGMCARILRAHAFELGIDPAFAVAEGAQVEEYLARAVDEVLAQAQSGESSPALDALFAEYPARSYGGYGVSVESMLSELVGEASSHAMGADSFELPIVSDRPAEIVEQAAAVVEVLLNYAGSEKEGGKRDEWMASAEQQLAAAHQALEEGVESHDQALRAIAPFKLAKTFGSKEYKARVDEARVVLATYVMKARLGAARPHLETLLVLAHRVLDAFARLKRADGVLDNNDLLVLAARAIEEHPAISACYTDKFKLVMVDEFQDTDQMQVDMIRRLSGDTGNRLCTVGDAQQSIYRFRGADVSVYRRHLESVRVEWPESVIELSDNFRSHPDVLAFVDRVFEKPGMFGGEFMSLHAGRDEGRVSAPFADDKPRIVVQHTTRPWRGVDSARVTEVAAQRIADEFASLADRGHKPDEMVVLLGRMVHADVYARALRDRGLPCVVAGGSVFSRTLEANIALELVRVLANPRETQSLFNVLTSPLFCLTAGDLLVTSSSAPPKERVSLDASSPRAKVSRLLWLDLASPVPSGKRVSPQLECALRVMARARASIGRVPVARIMEQVALDSGWLSRMQTEGAEGLASAANLFKAIRMVSAIEKSGPFGPASVARKFADELANSKEAPGALSVSGGDSVRIMTVHASKGLEFPIVAVADFKDSRVSSSRLIATSLEGKAYVSLDLGRTLDTVGESVDSATMAKMAEYELGLMAGEDELAAAVIKEPDALCRRLALREHAAVGDEEEAKRLLYVALTRAKEALIVSMTGVRTKDNPAGIPKNVFAGVLAAFGQLEQGFEEGRALCDFGGSAPSVVECVALSAEDDEVPCEDNADASAREFFLVPDAEDVPSLAHDVFRPLHQGIFSYSSISDGAHEGDVLDRLADAFAVTVDEPAEEDGFADDVAEWRWQSTVAFDDDFWDVDPSRAFDEDRATDLGTAFHRLAQYAVMTRKGDGPLVMPPAERIEALSRTCNLDGEQRVRLGEALQRWFGCDVAHEMASLADLASEVPFFVAVSPGEAVSEAYLEGEIDLLGFDETHDHATVVDYKTGGRAGETLDELRCKHVLQAACYAYAIMQQGVGSVDAIFVRVERSRTGDPSQPQCVRYRFTSEDIPVLAQVIDELFSRM